MPSPVLARIARVCARGGARVADRTRHTHMQGRAVAQLLAPRRSMLLQVLLVAWLESAGLRQ